MKGLITAAGTALCLLAGAASAAPVIDKDYVRSLAAPGKTVLVIEYYNGKGEVAERKGFSSANGYRALSGMDIQVSDKITVHLYGVQPCDGSLVNRAEGFSGTCADFAKEQLQIMVQSPKVLFCRAFITEIDAPKQNVTCWGYYYYPNAMDSVDMLEEQLVSLGAVKIARKKDGSPERPDLLEAERIGKNGSYGMWADPRINTP
ncbi:hypothetical protein [Rhizobium sp. RM]|uniref:hypothetical protein n=1 Tax=Rhizobium sp. RM TaxID=2748079 RepID=UPI00110E1462|nr:hypothetical protein [Rhizobium sp. RM]NWJ25389.1 hypothetical protein [Rhizobium sp. RM]TMV17529.1 hypothetical protein BJG94_16280 [Rhizobium sp. Td3]